MNCKKILHPPPKKIEKVVNSLTNCTMLFGNNFGEKNYEIKLDFIIYFKGNMSRYGCAPYHLNDAENSKWQ